MNVLIIGYGHIGKPLFDIVSEKYPAEWLDAGAKNIRLKPDTIHICYPYDKNFEVNTVGYLMRFKPSLCIIESTIPVGTTRVLSASWQNIVHSPVRGREQDDMRKCILTYTKYAGAVNDGPAREAINYYKTLGIHAKDLGPPESTEAAKLWDTTIRTVNFALWNEIGRFCEKHNVHMEAITEFIRTGNEETGESQHRPIHKAEAIGGHCLMQNLDILISQSNSSLLRAAGAASRYEQ